MIHVKRFAITLFAVLMFFGAAAVIDASAQKGSVVYRPVIVRHYVYDPFWYDRYWFNAHWADPYLMERRERYYRERAVRDARRKLQKDAAKFRSDGVITPKEQQKLAKRQEKYEKAVDKLRKYRRDRNY